MNLITILLTVVLAAQGLFPLHSSKVLYSTEDAPVVATAAGLFASDVEAVTGEGCISISSPSKGNLVIVGTAASPYVSRLAGAELKALEGRWESYSMKLVRNPFPGVRQALVIAGSDPRGAAYGLMDLSRQIGVSPWYWWCDIPVRRQAKVYVTPIAGPSKEPSVKYRGIFINDEDWGLRNWAGIKDPTGDIGPDTYEKVCELLLRLKANHLLPAMHKCTSPFYSFAQNPAVADKYGIVVGTSHCEPLLFNNATEWDVERDGEWNYEENREGVLKAMDGRVAQAAGYENIYTVGMRGIHDHPMEAENEKKKAEITENVIRDQRAILEKHLGRPAETIPQAFTPYKEVLTTYDFGMDLPDDITIVWPDDNFGHMKRVSSPLEQKRSGRSGVYYHVSYLGLPDAHLWFSTTSTTLMYAELLKAYRATADRIWIVNCGDIKCCEMQVDFFLRLAFDVDAFDYDKAASFPTDFLCEIAGEEFRPDIDASMGTALRLAASRRPDQMSWQWVMTLKKPAYASAEAETDFSFDNYNEAGRRLAEYSSAEAAVDRVMAAVPEDCRAAMFELLEFPVKSAAAVNRSYLGVQQYRLWHRQGRAAAADAKKVALKARNDVFALQKTYWTMLDGKWDRIVKCQRERQLKDMSRFPDMPVLSSVPCVGVSAHIGEFSSLTRRSGLIEVFAKSSVPAGWTAETSDGWILLSSCSGRTAGVDSIKVDIDWNRVPAGRELSGYVCIRGAGCKEYVPVKAFNPAEGIAPGTFVEDDGVVSIEAAAYTRLGACDSVEVRRIGGIGIEGSALMFGDADGTLHDYRTDSAPHAEYDFWCSDAGSVDVYVYLVPQFPLYKDQDFKIYNGSNAGIRYGVMIDDLAPRMEPEMNMVEFGENHKVPVLHECFINKGTLCIDKPGMHTLKLMCGNEGVMFQKIVLDFGGLKRSWNGPETTESRYPGPSAPVVVTQDLFKEIPVRQCHAATIEITSAGTRLVSFFGGTKELVDDVDIYLCRQEAGDTAWSAPVKIVDGVRACQNPVLFRPDDSRVLLFYKTGNKIAEWRGLVTGSVDDGLTWSEPDSLPAGLFGPIKNQPVKLASGRVISPSSDESGRWTAHFEISDDSCRSWRKVGPVKADDSLDVIQPAVLTCRDGSLLALCRSRNGKIAATRSRDDGESWSRMELTDFPNNNSGLDATTLPDGRFVLVCNPTGMRPGKKSGPRTPLGVFVSSDEGYTWDHVATLETEPGEFSYPTVICDPSESDVVHIVYTWKRERIKYARIKL